MRFPELVFLDAHAPLLFFTLGGAIGYLCGFTTMAYVWCGATCLSWNCVQLVNSVVHMAGERRYVVKVSPDCQSGNIWWLWPFMLGANWHNNHHAFPNCAREGFEWYEIDVLYYVLRVWQALGLVWNVRQVRVHTLHAACQVPLTARHTPEFGASAPRWLRVSCAKPSR